jgi:hypothetical protein
VWVARAVPENTGIGLVSNDECSRVQCASGSQRAGAGACLQNSLPTDTPIVTEIGKKVN